MSIPAEIALDLAVQFEQKALRSRKARTCIDCGEPGSVPQGPTAYCHVVYFMCEECDTYWREKL